MAKSIRERSEERATWGWLGKPPDAVIKRKGDIWLLWVRLSKQAKEVARMPNGKDKNKKREEIERQRKFIIRKAEELDGA